ncbi:MAG: hypothetical protein WC955_03265 [Elusimicrobiota bacterium]
MKKIGNCNTIILLLVSALFSMVTPCLYGEDLYVVADQYAYVIASNSGYDLTSWGGKSKWDEIVLWGRIVPRPSYGGTYANYQYRWVYGDGTSKGWVVIPAFDSANPLAASYKYLRSDSHQYSTVGSEPITYYTATLEIRNASTLGIVDSMTVRVKAVNPTYITVANDYPDPAKARRLIVESIAKGRGLLWLYLYQGSAGNWSGKYFYANAPETPTHPMADTALCLAAFLVHGHSVYDPGGVKDIFVECVNKGINYLLKNAVILNSQSFSSGAGYGSDINSNGKMVRFSNKACHHTYEHGICMLTLGAAYNPIRVSSQVHVGSSNTLMYFSHVLSDAVDWAAWAEIDVSTPTGWRYLANDPQDEPDLSATQWIVLGLSAIEDIWGIEAPVWVKNRLMQGGYGTQSVIRSLQWQGGGTPNYDGGGFYYFRHNTPVTSYSTVAHLAIPSTLIDEEDYWITGTSALLQTLFYISLDTTTVVACACNTSWCNSIARDCTLNKTAPANSCSRVEGAINFLGRWWDNPRIDTYANSFRPSTTCTSNPAYCGGLYNMYGIMKSLRLHNYVKGGINNGILRTGATGNSVSQSGGTAVVWEDVFSNFILKMQQPTGGGGYGYWVDNWGYTDSSATKPSLGTAFALLLLSETVYYPSTIKTELMEPQIRRASIK